MTHELNMHELDLVSGGLRRQPDKDRANQAAANRNDGSNTVGGSIQGNLITPCRSVERQLAGIRLIFEVQR
jgi:hypothetical protein